MDGDDDTSLAPSHATCTTPCRLPLPCRVPLPPPLRHDVPLLPSNGTEGLLLIVNPLSSRLKCNSTLALGSKMTLSYLLVLKEASGGTNFKEMQGGFEEEN